MPLPIPIPPSALSLNQDAASHIPPPPDYAHPMVEEYVRRIASGELTAEQAFGEVASKVQQLQQAQPQQGQELTPSGEPQQAPGMSPEAPPAPSLAAPQPQAPAPRAPIQVASQLGSPSIAPELAGRPGQSQGLGTPAAQLQAPQQAPSLDASNQPAPLPNQGNEAPSPTFDQNLAAARNQIQSSLTEAQPRSVRPQVRGQDLAAQAAQAAQASQPAEPATGRQAAMNAIYGLGPRMTNKDVAVFMDAFVKGGKPAIEAEKERGRAWRASMNNDSKLRIATRREDLREQRTADQWEAETNRLSLDKRREANKVALAIEGFDVAHRKLNAAMIKFAGNREDKVALLDMKLAHDEMMQYVKSASQMGASLMAEAPSTAALIQDATARAGEAAKNYEAVRNYTVATQSSGNAPAPDRQGATVPKMDTASEAAQKVTKAGVGAQRRSLPIKIPTAAPQAAPASPAPQAGDKIQVRRKSDGQLGTISRSAFRSDIYEMVSK